MFRQDPGVFRQYPSVQTRSRGVQTRSRGVQTGSGISSDRIREFRSFPVVQIGSGGSDRIQLFRLDPGVFNADSVVQIGSGSSDRIR